MNAALCLCTRGIFQTSGISSCLTLALALLLTAAREKQKDMTNTAARGCILYKLLSALYRCQGRTVLYWRGEENEQEGIER